MVVTEENFDEVLAELKCEFQLGLDTETTGLRMYHGDRLFSIIIASVKNTYYFNFAHYPGLPRNQQLDRFKHLDAMQDILFSDKSKMWFIQNAANFDMPVLDKSGLELLGEVHCTKAIGRVEYNDHMGYSLDEQLKRIGLSKDDAVKKHIEAQKLWTIERVPGRKVVSKKLHYDKVPFDIIVPYGEQDARGTLELGAYQLDSIMVQDKDSRPDATLVNVYNNEVRLQHTIFRMKHRGVLIDKEYCQRAIKYEEDRHEKARGEFKKFTGSEYLASPKLFSEVFIGDRENWKYTEKGNPSFESGTLKLFDHPGAKSVLEVRESKSNSDFYQGFMHHADRNGRIHPNYNPEGAAHGRFSSSEPNFQNLTNDTPGEFSIRRAIIPSPGYIFITPDYDQMEYRFMLEMACRILGKETKLVKLIKEGLDVHEATSKVASERNVKITREEAKTSNFLTLYGGGAQKLADGLKCDLTQAKDIRSSIFIGAPEIRTYINHIMGVAERRGFIVNWLGRRCHFPNRNYSYKAPNYHCSGGCADIVKVAMNRIDAYLLKHRSKLVVTIHDELVLEVHESEVDIVPPAVKTIMEGVFHSNFLPLTTGMEYAIKSLGDKIEGMPNGFDISKPKAEVLNDAMGGVV